MNAALGDVSKAGVGLPEFEVTHSGARPMALVAVQPAGSAGAVTPSKFSWNIGVDCGIAVGSRAEFASPLAVTRLRRNEASSRGPRTCREASSSWLTKSSFSMLPLSGFTAERLPRAEEATFPRRTPGPFIKAVLVPKTKATIAMMTITNRRARANAWTLDAVFFMISTFSARWDFHC